MSNNVDKAIVFGGSAGSVIVLFELLKRLPRTFPVPLIVVIHRPNEEGSKMREVFQSQSKVPIIEPREPTPLENGKVYLAPPGLHLVVEPDKKLNVDNSPLVQYSKPSIDVLFISAADAFRENLTGILVTGSNSDGALGMKMINENKGTTIVQDPKDAKMYRMPESAIRMTKIDHIMKSEDIYKYLQNYGF